MLGTGLVMKLARQIDTAVKDEMVAEQGRIMGELQQLHRAVETGEMQEDVFEGAEARLLVRLKELKEMQR
ncbi:MAG: hypothetical protein AAGE01_10280 [Pseudomonadota bacterium]